jgi:hypothetical protein
MYYIIQSQLKIRRRASSGIRKAPFRSEDPFTEQFNTYISAKTGLSLKRSNVNMQVHSQYIHTQRTPVVVTRKENRGC